MNMVSAAVKVMQHAEQFKDADPHNGGDAGAHAEQLRLMLDAMWASNALDIQQTVAKVCQLVRGARNIRGARTCRNKTARVQKRDAWGAGTA